MSEPSALESIFFAALQKRVGAERNEFLGERCAGNPEQRAQLERMLAAATDAVSFLERPAVAEATAWRPEALAIARPGTVIGPYKLLQQLGEGGMGIVFMAEQSQPIQRTVALKIIKPGMNSRLIVARFGAERQALALMDHPNVAKVLDAGATETGLPYFVMELVKGVPITKYCDEHQLSLRERLALFLQVCDAVQHAHHKGVIHRDIKPSNVLVAEYDQRPVPKVIDFGVAKATAQKLTERTLFTEFGQVVGTIEYMSPEQAKLNQLDVDTRSDIYSLGVLFYELLTGSTPFGRKRLLESAFDEMLRIIREEEPPRPSTRLSTAEGLPSIAANRGIESVGLTRMVRGELDWIVMKSLEKDRNRRYETVNGFAQDIQHYLDDEPVKACPPSARYRLKKFLRRNKWPAMAASLVVLALIAGVAGTTWGLLHSEHNRRKAERALAAETEARQAERQARDKAMAALRLMTDEVVHDQMARETYLRDEDKEFLRKIIQHFEGFAAITSNDAESRAIRAEGNAQVGAIRRRLGELKEAEAALANSANLFKQLTVDFPSRPHFRQELARSQTDLGILLRATNRFGEAEAAFAEALAIYTQLAAEFPTHSELRENLARSHNNLGNLFSEMGRMNEAEAAYVDALDCHKQLVADFPNRPDFRRDMARAQNNLGILLRVTGRLRDAEAAFTDALATHKKLAADFPDRPDFRQDVARGQNNVGILYRETGRLKEAENAYADAMAIDKHLAAEFPTVPEFRSDLGLNHTNLGRIYSATGRLEEAENEYDNALAIQKKLAADFPTRADFRLQMARSQNKLGVLHEDSGRFPEAEAAITEALAITRQLAADYPSSVEFREELAGSHNNLGVLFRVTGRLTEAEAAFADALVLKKQLAADFPNQPERHQSLANTFANLANLCEQRGDFVSWKTYLEQALPHRWAALQANPRHSEYRDYYRNNLLELARANTWMNDRAGVVHAAEGIRALGWNAPIDTYNAARCVAKCIPIVQKLKQLDSAERQAASEFYSDKAMAMLRDAVAKGWKDAVRMKSDTDFDAIRQREDFQQLLHELD